MFSRSSLRTSSGTPSHTLSTPSGKSSCDHAFELFLSVCRKTVTALDVVYALKRSGRTLYGFGA